MGIIELVIAVILNKKYKKLLKKEANFAKALEASKQFMTERKNLYLHWLDENAFICSKQIGNLLFDFISGTDIVIPNIRLILVRATGIVVIQVPQ